LLNGIQQFKEVAHTCLLRKSATFGNHIGDVVYGSGGSGGSELGPLHPPGRFWVRSDEKSFHGNSSEGAAPQPLQ
jgi:hypothetical protein